MRKDRSVRLLVSRSAVKLLACPRLGPGGDPGAKPLEAFEFSHLISVLHLNTKNISYFFARQHEDRTLGGEK